MTGKKRHLHVVLCVCCVAALTLTMGWFASKFIPGTPRSPKTEVTQTRHGSGVSPYKIAADTVIAIPQGNTWTMEDLNQGKAYQREDFTDEEWASIPVDIQSYIEQRLPVLATEVDPHAPSGDSWPLNAIWTLPASSGLDVTVASTRTVTVEAFAEFYPAYLTSPDYVADDNRTVFLVDIVATNITDTETVTVPQFTLWSPDLRYADDSASSSIGMDKYLMGSLYPGSDEDAGKISNTHQDNWGALSPGETRTFTLAYLVRESDFANITTYQDHDLSQLCIEVFDYLPVTVYRLWLG